MPTIASKAMQPSSPECWEARTIMASAAAAAPMGVSGDACGARRVGAGCAGRGVLRLT
jgi:hypothetical protein